MKKEDGGPAFATSNDTHHQEGMSLRDWFAGMAMQGIISQETEDWNNSGSDNAKVYAVQAYEFADAMLKERNK